MPEISRFFGIIITMNFNDHNPPHIHASYGEHEATFNLQNNELIEGTLPKTATKLVKALLRNNLVNIKYFSKFVLWKKKMQN